MKIYRIVVSIVFLISFASQALAYDLVLTEKDFTNAKQWQQTLVQAELTQSGKEKINSLNEDVGKTVSINLKGEKTVLTIKAAIKDKLQFGPFTKQKAKEVVAQINNE